MRHALIDDVHRNFGQAIHIRFTGAKIAALDRVVKEAVNAVAVVLIIFRSIDSALGRDRMSAPRRILIAKALYPVAKLAQRRRGRTAGQPAAHDNNLELAAIIWTNKSGMIAMALPFLVERARRNFGVERSNHNGSQNSKSEIRNPKQTPENLNAEITKTHAVAARCRF